MREIHVSAIVDAVKKLCMEANYSLEPDMLRAFAGALQTERSRPGGRCSRSSSRTRSWPGPRRSRTARTPASWSASSSWARTCTSPAGGLYEAINEGVRQGYKEGYLRASIVRSPFDRVNTGDNTPAVIHLDVVPGSELHIQIMAKGGGCENRSKYKMLTPAEGVDGVKEWILECIRTAGPDACPPLIAGVGVGGTFEQAARLSKKALFRELGAPNPDPMVAAHREGRPRARQPARHRAPGLRRRHHRVRHPHPHVPLPHHEPAGRGDHRMPRASPQGGDAMSVTIAAGRHSPGGDDQSARRSATPISRR